MKVVVCVEVPYKFACRFAKVCEMAVLFPGLVIRAHVEDDAWLVTVYQIDVSTASEMLIAYCDFRDENMTTDYRHNPEKCETIFSAFEEDPSWEPFGDYPKTSGIPDGPSERDCVEMLKVYAAKNE
jgi:hypothetical protein